MHGFDFYIGNIEDAILHALETPLKDIGVRAFDTYSGELDAGNLKQALGALSMQFPLILVSYAEGADTPDPKTPPVLRRSLHFRHDCEFVVICASADARGETARRRGRPVGNVSLGVYTMVAKVREVLGGLILKKTIALPDDEVENVLLTHDPLKPVGVEYIARMPNITAYAAVFSTYFRYSTPDRSAEGTAVSELVISSDSLNDELAGNDNLPGVIRTI